MSVAALVLAVIALGWCSGLSLALRRLHAGRHRGIYRDGERW